MLRTDATKDTVAALKLRSSLFVALYYVMQATIAKQKT
jgi:hypothetical protein